MSITWLESAAQSSHTHLEEVFSHPWITFDSDKKSLLMNESALEAISMLIRETQEKMPKIIVTPDSDEIHAISPDLIDGWITNETLTVNKKGHIRWLVWNILSMMKKRQKVPHKKIEKATKMIHATWPCVHVWVKIEDTMLPVPLMIWQWSTIDTVRVWFETRLRYAWLLGKRKEEPLR